MNFYSKPISYKRKIFNFIIQFFKIFLKNFSIEKRAIVVNPKIILYVCLAERGDIIMSSASVNYIKSRFPKSKIYYACKHNYSNIVNLITSVDFVIPFQKIKNITDFYYFIKQIYSYRKLKFDVVFDETGSILTTFFWRMINPRNAYSINQHGLAFLGTNFIELTDGQDILLRRKMLLELFFKHIDGKFKPQILINYNSDVLLDNSLEEKKYITFQPNGGWPEKSIDKDLLLTFINIIITIYNLPIVFLGAEQEYFNIQKTIDLVNSKNIKNFAGKLSISNSVYMVKNALIHIGVDSFLRHVSIAVDTPSLTIFGPTSHLLSGYSDELHVSVYSDIDCRPFFNQYCILDAGRNCGHLSCMKNINENMITNSLLNIKNKVL